MQSDVLVCHKAVVGSELLQCYASFTVINRDEQHLFSSHICISQCDPIEWEVATLPQANGETINFLDI